MTLRSSLCRLFLPAATCVVVLGLVAPARAADCDTGRVFADANGNARFDAGERPVAGARVSDGATIVDTDAAGRYRLHVADGRTLFVIKPAGYDAPLRADGLPDTWLDVRRAAPPGPPPGAGRAAPAPPPGATCRDFALRPRAPHADDAPLDLLVFGDPQPKSLRDVDYYARDIIAPLRAAPDATLALSLGDIVNDDVSLYPALKRVDASLGLPWLHAPGNHDLDAGAASDVGSLDGFHAAFGADTFAWEEAHANLVVLDDVIAAPGGGKPYVGGLREDQFAFLAAYLARADRSRLLVVALHIPLFDVGGMETFRHADRARLFALLAPFPHVLVLSAHTHAQQHAWHGADEGWAGAAPLHEYNVGAACGSFWSGVKDADGIPVTTMADGTPNGYARLRVGASGEPTLRWFAARAPADAQMHLHGPGVLRRGAWPGIGLYANVWMGDATTPVAFRVDAGAWTPMQRVLQPDPAVLAENLRDDDAPALRGYDRLPEAVPSTHLWRGALPTALAVGEHRVEVRAQVAGFGTATATTVYTLADAPP